MASEDANADYGIWPNRATVFPGLEKRETSRTQCFSAGTSRKKNIFFLMQVAQFGGRFHGDTDGVSEQIVEGLKPEHLRAEDYAEVA